MKKAVVGIVEKITQAEALVTELHSIGVPSSEISVLLPSKTGTNDFAHEHGTKSPEGAVAGAGVGGIMGGAFGLLVGVGALAIPGLGPFIAAGPLMATLSGVAAGAAAGGLTGALIGLGIPEYEAKLYEGKVRGGNLLIAVHSDDAKRRESVVALFKRAGAADVATMTESAVPSRPGDLRQNIR